VDRINGGQERTVGRGGVDAVVLNNEERWDVGKRQLFTSYLLTVGAAPRPASVMSNQRGPWLPAGSQEPRPVEHQLHRIPKALTGQATEQAMAPKFDGFDASLHDLQLWLQYESIDFLTL